MPCISSSARSAPSGSSNSANPKPWGLLAGVIRRLNDLMGPHALEGLSETALRGRAIKSYRQYLVQECISDATRY